MPLSEFKQGSVICNEGEPLRFLMFITKGSVEASFDEHPLRLGQGDMIGLCDLGSGHYSHAYTALTDVSVFSYPYSSFDTVDVLMHENADVAFRLINSMCRQITDFLRYRAALKREAAGTYDLIQEVYSQYESLCALYALTPKKIHGLSGIAPFSETDPVADWMDEYYMEISGLSPAVLKGFFHGKPGISTEFIHRSTADILQVFHACRVYQDYMRGISQYLLNGDGHDLFALMSDLHYKSTKIQGADAAVEPLMARLTGALEGGMTGVGADDYLRRLNAYQEGLAAKRTSQTVTETPVADSGPKQNLSDSLETILFYSGCPEEFCNKFTRAIKDYTALSDRGGSDDGQRLRKELTPMFYTIYQEIFIKSLKDPSLPTIIKMFLSFGYVDAELAGHENADFMYSVADSLKGDPASGVYTLREWLLAVYEGRKEPCRNEFDEDYPTYIRQMKTTGKIDEKEEKALLTDLEGKLRFEMENVFPIVNKITFGQISIFCPVFGDHTVQRKLETSMVTPALVKQAIDEIRAVDYSAYYRQQAYAKPEWGVPNETINIEVLPDIILMPNVGVRGAMWQEIEGRKRTTPARMFMSQFLQTDLKNLLIRLTGEFRWEMCKRIQGARWNDVTEPSLTSEFCDYLQFYRNNREFPIETKDAIREELVRAKNNFRTVYVSNYTEWLLYESSGALRLNKNVRRMLLAYCPFPLDIREKLIQNPQYAELLTRHNFKLQQRIQHLSNVLQKINRAGKSAPKELQEEMEYLKR
jgi:CRP-like cAMP-binding protein